MASLLAVSSVLIFLLLAAFAAGASAATFSIRNNCSYTVWPAAIPVGGGLQLNPGQTWTLDVPAGTKRGRIWGRTDCSFSGGDIEHCETGDCAEALSCTVSGQPPTTLAEFAIAGGSGARDYHVISLIDGYNHAMDFSCSTGVTLQCRDPNCLPEYHYPAKIPSCKGNSNYQVTFCP